MRAAGSFLRQSLNKSIRFVENLVSYHYVMGLPEDVTILEASVPSDAAAGLPSANTSATTPHEVDHQLDADLNEALDYFAELLEQGAPLFEHVEDFE